MANCGEYLLLTPKERTEFIGRLIHSCQSDSKLFAMGERIIKQATKQGIFDGVLINPITPDTTEQNKKEDTDPVL